MEGWKLRAALGLTLRRPIYVLGALRGPKPLARLRRALDLGITEEIQRRYFLEHPDGLARARGFELYLHRTCHIFSATVMRTGDYEPRTTDLAAKLLQPGSTFVDIGANIGWFTLLAAKLGSKVYAYEPEPGNVELLERSLQKNGFLDVEVRPIALGDHDGTVPLWISEESAGWHSTVERRGNRKIDVPCRSLDSLFPTQRLDLVKLDVEGAEPLVLAGASRLLAERRMTTILMEWNAEAWEGHGALLEPFDMYLTDGTTRFDPRAAVPERNVLLRLRA